MAVPRSWARTPSVFVVLGAIDCPREDMSGVTSAASALVDPVPMVSQMTEAEDYAQGPAGFPAVDVPTPSQHSVPRAETCDGRLLLRSLDL